MFPLKNLVRKWLIQFNEAIYQYADNPKHTVIRYH